MVKFSILSIVSRVKSSNRKTTRLNRDFGLLIRNIRKSKSLTSEDLSASTGLHVTYISSLENGHRNPTLNVIAILAEGLGHPLDELFLKLKNQKTKD